MIQQVLALIFIAYFIIRLFGQNKKSEISGGEFRLWLVFWLLAGLSIIFVKQIDYLAARVGFSSSGIQILLYFAIVILFYFNFRLRLKVESLNRNLTKLVRDISISRKK